jgi:hypothetical protein
MLELKKLNTIMSTQKHESTVFKDGGVSVREKYEEPIIQQIKAIHKITGKPVWRSVNDPDIIVVGVSDKPVEGHDMYCFVFDSVEHAEHWAAHEGLQYIEYYNKVIAEGNDK